ncbi:hypothetical protein F183_A41580 [Bryobacterales bacterium F-183]|nr:hypothetical protein F183_A41580 [Bryobacterales bacterium F-183]
MDTTTGQGSVVQVSASRGGVPKLPVLGGQVHKLGLEGDACRNLKYHGGPNQALLVITENAIDDLVAQGFEVYAGALGENLTVRGVDHRQFRIGQRWRIGQEVWIEFTKIRVPCRTLDVYGEGRIQKAVYDKVVKAGDPSSPLWAKGGMYAKVVTPGFVAPGDAFVLMEDIA